MVKEAINGAVSAGKFVRAAGMTGIAVIAVVTLGIVVFAAKDPRPDPFTGLDGSDLEHRIENSVVVEIKRVDTRIDRLERVVGVHVDEDAHNGSKVLFAVLRQRLEAIIENQKRMQKALDAR